jgi:hypothetical protein
MTQSSGRLERAALIAEIVGGLAVVISVIYLALQISDNNRLLRSQSHYNALDIASRPWETMMGNKSLAEAIYQCDPTPYEVHDSVWPQCFSYYFILFNGWEYSYYQNLAGTVPPEWYEGVDGYFTAEAESKAGYVRFWKETAHAFGEPFRSHVEEHIQINPAMHLPIIE